MNPPLPNFYDVQNAAALVQYAAETYSSHPSPASHLIENPATDTRAVISHLGEDTILAFRGTRSLQNFLTDISCRRVPVFPGAKAEVHHGFQRALDSIWAPLEDAIRSWASAGDGARLWLTGHSLGAALAKLCAWRISNFKFEISNALAGVYTFGEPRVGNGAFAGNYDFWLRSKTFRVVDGEDFITRIPWLLAAFRHCGTEIFYDSLGRAHVAPPWWVKGPGDIFGTWAEWQRSGRIALLADHHINRYVNLLSIPSGVSVPSVP